MGSYKFIVLKGGGHSQIKRYILAMQHSRVLVLALSTSVLDTIRVLDMFLRGQGFTPNHVIWRWFFFMEILIAWIYFILFSFGLDHNISILNPILVYGDNFGMK